MEFLAVGKFVYVFVLSSSEFFEGNNFQTETPIHMGSRAGFCPEWFPGHVREQVILSI